MIILKIEKNDPALVQKFVNVYDADKPLKQLCKDIEHSLREFTFIVECVSMWPLALAIHSLCLIGRARHHVHVIVSWGLYTALYELL